MKLTKALALAALLSTPLVAMAHEYDSGNLHIDHPWSREMPPTAPTAASAARSGNWFRYSRAALW